MTQSTISLLSLERIARKAGAKRISASAIRELRDYIEEEGIDIATKAAQLARHANRKTVKEEDIKFILKRINK